MDNGKSKSQSFIELLPEIYRRRLISKDNYRAICNWLKDTHGLDFFEKNDEKPDSEKTYYLFTNYLKKYGNIKKAKEHYIENVNTTIEESWWKDFVDENNKPVEKPSKPFGVNAPVKAQDVNTDNDVGKRTIASKPSPKADPTSLSATLGLNSKSNDINYHEINPFDGFDESILKKK